MTMTTQEAFAHTVLAVYIQGEKSTDEQGDCAYRGQGNLKCVVGHVIADEHYTPDMEGLTPQDEPVARALIASGIPPGALGLLQSLQTDHDYADDDNFREDFWRCAQNTASIFDLAMPEKPHV